MSVSSKVPLDPNLALILHVNPVYHPSRLVIIKVVSQIREIMGSVIALSSLMIPMLAYLESA